MEPKTNKLKRVLLIVSFLVILILAIIAGYYFFFLKKAPAGSGGETGFPSFPSEKLPPLQDDDEIPLSSGAGGEVLPRLRQISSVPTAGGTIFSRAGITAIRYLERGTGNVYEAMATSSGKTRITNTTIPKVYEAVWTANPDEVLLRYLDEAEIIQTFIGKVSKKAPVQSPNASPSALAGSYLQNNISELAVSPKKDKIFYLTASGSWARGIIANPDGAKRVEIFSNPLRGWLASWPGLNTVALNTKPSAGEPGHIYFLNTASGALSKVIGGIAGLTTLVRPDTEALIYSASSDNSVSLSAFEMKNRVNRPFNFRTFPEKCLWSGLEKTIVYCGVPASLPAASYPDAWYQGLVSFRDEIWKIDTASGTGEVIVKSADSDNPGFDVTNLALDPKENYLIFINKNDLTLWALRIK